MAVADERLAILLARRDRNGLERMLDEMCGSQPGLFASCYVVNANAILVAHSPPANDVIGLDVSWRDYFQGAKKLGIQRRKGSLYIAHVYRGRSDNLYKFAIAAPILDRKNNFLGVISTSVTTDATMGPVILHDSRQVAFLAPRDVDGPEPGEQAKRDKYVVLFHPAYSDRKGLEAVEFPYMNNIRMKPGLMNTQQSQLSDSNLVIPPDDNYIDPVSSVAKEYAGRWIAGFAPVGNTGFLVVVQQRFEDAVSLESSTLWNLALWSALASLVAVAILVMVLWRWARSRRLEAD